MEGGIRDIEFILQTLQLMYGNKYPELRSPNTLEGIRRAHRRKLIKTLERDALTKAYSFFRLIEHRLQMMHQLKTHSIPQSTEEIDLLARRVSHGPLGKFTTESFLSSLASHLNKIRLLSDSFFDGEELPESALLLLLAQDDELANSILGRFGFTQPKQAMTILQSLAYGTFPALVGGNTRASFQKLLPQVLEDLSRAGDPGAALVNFSRIAVASRSLGSFYTLLGMSAPFRSVITTLAATSSLLTRILCANMEILEGLVDNPAGLTAAELDLGPRRAGPLMERVPPSLRRALDRRLVASWVLDVETKTFPQSMSRVLTDTVRALVTLALDAAERDHAGVALFAMGSFAVGEPRPSSDADLLVVTRDRDMEATTRVVHSINRMFSGGGLPKLDFRLRGEGASAPLVQDIAQYEKYFASRMQPWETVAFAKCAHWGGDPSLADAFTGAIAPHLTKPPTRDTIESLIKTRGGLEGLVPAGVELLETKRSAGGRYDIEYLCAVGLTRLTGPYPFDASTTERLVRLENQGVITAAQAQTMRHALHLYTTVDYLLDLQEFPLPTDPDQTRALVHYLDRTLDLLDADVDGGVEAALTRYKREVRACYEAVLRV
jgi:glutamate-ammonia-ligase adenylyltransferase